MPRLRNSGGRRLPASPVSTARTPQMKPVVSVTITSGARDTMTIEAVDEADGRARGQSHSLAARRELRKAGVSHCARGELRWRPAAMTDPIERVKAARDHDDGLRRGGEAKCVAPPWRPIGVATESNVGWIATVAAGEGGPASESRHANGRADELAKTLLILSISPGPARSRALDSVGRDPLARVGRRVHRMAWRADVAPASAADAWRAPLQDRARARSSSLLVGLAGRHLSDDFAPEQTIAARSPEWLISGSSDVNSSRTDEPASASSPGR